MTDSRDDFAVPLERPEPERSFDDFVKARDARTLGSPESESSGGESAETPDAAPVRETIEPANDSGTYALGAATVPPKWGGGLAASAEVALPEPLDASEEPAEPTADRAAEDESSPSRPPKPKLRDWLEARCRKEAKMYALGTAALAPAGGLAVIVTWGVAWLASPLDGSPAWLFATAVVAVLFWLSTKAGDGRTIRVNVDPGDRDLPPVSLDVPRGAGLTWLMYLAGSRDLPGVLRIVGWTKKMAKFRATSGH
ncbi:MAG: hypothetical protein AAF907_01615 [Planctomycetota bacterium]